MKASSLPSFPSLLLPLSIAALAALATAGCSIDIGEHSDGDSGVLRFEYTSLDGCLLGCKLDRPTLVGSEVTVTTRGLDASKRYVGRLAGANAGRIVNQSEHCSCETKNGDTSTSTGIDPTAACTASGAEKTCFHQMTFALTSAGETKLEILNGDTVVDRITVSARAATRIDLTPRVDGNDVAVTEGAYEVAVGKSVNLTAKAFADDKELLVGDNGVSMKSDNTKVLTTAFYGFKAVGRGEAVLKATATGAESTVAFRVVE